MKRVVITLLVLAVVAPAQVRIAQQTASSDPSQESPTLAARDVLYNRIAIVRRDGDALAGLLIGVKGDTLLLLIGGRNEKVAF